jgi:hypothetical protein
MRLTCSTVIPAPAASSSTDIFLSAHNIFIFSVTVAIFFQLKLQK